MSVPCDNFLDFEKLPLVRNIGAVDPRVHHQLTGQLALAGSVAGETDRQPVQGL